MYENRVINKGSIPFGPAHAEGRGDYTKKIIDYNAVTIDVVLCRKILLLTRCNMPTYEYICTECEHKFDVFQSMNDSPIEKCEKCDGKVRKLFGGAGIIFKGSGFYVNDYKKNENKKESTVAPACAAGGGCNGCPAANN